MSGKGARESHKNKRQKWDPLLKTSCAKLIQEDGGEEGAETAPAGFAGAEPCEAGPCGEGVGPRPRGGRVGEPEYAKKA